MGLLEKMRRAEAAAKESAEDASDEVTERAHEVLQIIGERVEGGLYAEYPPLDPAQWLYGEDLRHTIDFRGVYGTLLERWLRVEADLIVGGSFEKTKFL